MADLDDVRRLALALPETGEAGGAFHVLHRGKAKNFAWVWLERVHAGKARVPNPSALGVRVVGVDAKEALLALDPDVYFTEPHYDGYPAILVRLAAIGLEDLDDLLTDGWRCQAPRPLVRAFDAGEAGR